MEDPRNVGNELVEQVAPRQHPTGVTTEAPTASVARVPSSAPRDAAAGGESLGRVVLEDPRDHIGETGCSAGSEQGPGQPGSRPEIFEVPPREWVRRRFERSVELEVDRFDLIDLGYLVFFENFVEVACGASSDQLSVGRATVESQISEVLATVARHMCSKVAHRGRCNYRESNDPFNPVVVERDCVYHLAYGWLRWQVVGYRPGTQLGREVATTNVKGKYVAWFNRNRHVAPDKRVPFAPFLQGNTVRGNLVKSFRQWWQPRDGLGEEETGSAGTEAGKKAKLSGKLAKFRFGEGGSAVNEAAVDAAWQDLLTVSASHRRDARLLDLAGPRGGQDLARALYADAHQSGGQWINVRCVLGSLKGPVCNRRLIGCAERLAWAWDEVLCERFPKWHADTMGRARSAGIEAVGFEPAAMENMVSADDPRNESRFSDFGGSAVHDSFDEYLGEETAVDGLVGELVGLFDDPEK